MENPNVVVTPPVKTPPKKSGLPVFLQAFLGVLVAVILIVAGAAGAYYLMQKSPLTQKPANNTASNCLPGSLDCVNTTTGELPPITSTGTEAENPQPDAGALIAVQWTAPAKLSDQKIYKPNPDDMGGPVTPVYYQVGTITAGQYNGGKLILLMLPSSFTGTDSYSVNRFVLKDGEYYLLMNNSDMGSDYIVNNFDVYFTDKVKIDRATVIGELKAPATLTRAGYSQTITLKDNASSGFFNAKEVKFFSDFKFGSLSLPVYITAGYPTTYASLFDRHGFYALFPDNTVRVYESKVSFIQTDNNEPAKIIWYDDNGKVGLETGKMGTNNTNPYSLNDFVGCGQSNFISVVDPSVVKKSDLFETGLASDNTADIFEFIDPNHPWLKKMYEQSYSPADGKKMPYGEFVNSHPIIFFTDDFDRLIKAVNSKFAPMAECGKPVIYLYPEQTTDVSVKLAPQGGFSYTEPAYNGGWNVTAEPNGKLTNRPDNKVYPYLFWEGRGGIYQSPEKGFVVAQKDVHSFLVGKLAQAGLNAQETADFIEFWEPKMQGSPYYFVGFYGNAVMDELAPLSISPKPDTVIRILMDFQPLQKPVKVQGYDIRTPERKGFTVVEWGGVLR